MTRNHPRKPIAQLSLKIRPAWINLSLLLSMSEPSLKKKVDDEQFLSTAFDVELDDVKKTLVQLKLEKTQI